MQLTFLSGLVPLTKTITFSERDNQYTTTPYPHVQKVTSSTEEVTTLRDFANVVRSHGKLGHCLLKGSVDSPLDRQSRAGHAVEKPHQWIVFDFDKVDCEPSFAGALAAINKYLPEYARSVDCIVQLSASNHRPDATKLSCHIFMLLTDPVSTQQLTDWYTWVNFNTALKDELSLTDSCMGLHFPLDRTVSSPSRLLYIAPPRCVGFTPTINDAIKVYSGRNRTLTLQHQQPVPREVLDAKMNSLRHDAGMKERPYRTRIAHGMEIMTEADPCNVQDIRPSGEGYIRFNLNGGDSLAYFINIREPGLIHNFKGEPALMTGQVAPDLYKALMKAGKSLPQKLPPINIEPLAFFATNRQSTIYIGSYDREHDDLRVDASNAAAAMSWLKNFGMPLPTSLPHFDLTYDMKSDIRFEDGYPVINLYKRTDYIKLYADKPRSIPCDVASLGALQHEVPTLWRITHSALGSNINATFYFINWLAAIFQRRTRNESAWILHGTQGTGKGMMINFIMRPLFGGDSVTQQLYSLLNTNFNAYMEGKLIVVFNEAALSRSLDWTNIRSKMYDWITEPFITVNGKGKDERSVRNYANIILCSNDPRPAVIEEGDRRFNVGEYQSDRLFLTPNEFATLAEERELKGFAEFLGRWEVSDEMLLKPYAGEAKERIFEATHSLVDAIGFAIKNGDAQFFLDNRPDAVQLRTDFGGKMLPVREYDALLRAMATHTLNVLHQSDLYTLFRMVAMTDKAFPESRAEQRRIYQRHNLLSDKSIKDRRTGKAVRGIEAKWRVDSALAAQIEEALEPPTDFSNVRSIIKEAK